jgi:hypothetical protein
MHIRAAVVTIATSEHKDIDVDITCNQERKIIQVYDLEIELKCFKEY